MADPIQYLMANEQEQPKLGALDRLMFQQPQGFGSRLQDVWNSPTPGGIFDLAKSLYTGVRGAGRAASGGYTAQPEVPGQWSEADEFRQQQARQTMQGDAGAAAGAAMMGAFPMAQRGALGMAGGKMTTQAGEFNPTKYSEQLTAALHADNGVGFPALVEQLKSLPADQLKVIAKEFAGVSATSATDAIKKIYHRFNAMEMMRAKERANMGRSAG